MMKDYQQYIKEDIKTSPVLKVKMFNKYEDQVDEMKTIISDFFTQMSKIGNEVVPYRYIIPSNESRILNHEQLDKIRSWITDKKRISLKLIYRASEEGFIISKIYPKILDTPNCLMVIKTNKDDIIGCFHERPRNPEYKQRPGRAFSFSLNENYIITESFYYKLPNLRFQTFFYPCKGLGLAEGSNSTEGSFHYIKREEKHDPDHPTPSDSPNVQFLTEEIELFEVDFVGKRILPKAIANESDSYIYNYKQWDLY